MAKQNCKIDYPDVVIDEKSDLYSIGICLYNVLTNQYPFTDKRDEFFKAMEEQKQVSFSDAFVQTHQSIKCRCLMELILRLTRQNRSERISWEQFRKYCKDNYLI